MHYRNSDFLNDLYYRRIEFFQTLNVAYHAGKHVYINEVRKINNCKQARKLKGDIQIKEIFDLGWSDFITKHSTIRTSIRTNVKKMLSCGSLTLGFSYYECPNCGNFHIQKFTCKSRFCASCGKKYRDKIATEVSKKIYAIPHRQLVFTVPFELRKYFRLDRSLLNVLFSATSETLTKTLQEKAPNKYKSEKRKLGFVCFLHTFGRDMKWHPHIHVLYAEKFLRENGTFGDFYYLAFEAVRKRFLYTLVNKIKHYYKNNKSLNEQKELQSTINVVMKRCKNGAYFYGKKTKEFFTLKSAKAIANYISRYASHPAISERRIINFDEEQKQVTRFYDPHEDDTNDEEHKIGRQYVTEDIESFYKRLIIHIPETGFQQIRYYGFYSNACKTKTSKAKLFSTKDIEKYVLRLKWKYGLLYAFGYNPLLCECGTEMIYNRELSFIPGVDTT